MSAQKYFVVMTGLRGCYMPDSCYHIVMKTRRELKEYVEFEASHQRESGYVGLSKRRVAQFAALCWRHCESESLPFALGYGEPGGGQPYGIMIGRSSRAELKEYQESES